MSQSKTPTCGWRGASRRTYTFYIFPLPCSFKPDQDGNYIYSRRDAEGLWVPIYIGEGDLARRSNPGSHHRGDCIQRQGATHFHCHVNADKDGREAEETDLRKYYTNAYVPKGCNRQRPLP